MSPTLLLDLRLEAGYTFAPFGCLLRNEHHGRDSYISPIRTYRQNLSIMRESNDPNGSEVTNLCSLGVVDLDLSLCPDVFGLKAFDEKMPITRMLPGSSRCELRLLLPDTKIGKDGFHDVVVENLIGSSTWRSRHVSPSDVIALPPREYGPVAKCQ